MGHVEVCEKKSEQRAHADANFLDIHLPINGSEGAFRSAEKKKVLQGFPFERRWKFGVVVVGSIADDVKSGKDGDICKE